MLPAIRLPILPWVHIVLGILLFLPSLLISEYPMQLATAKIVTLLLNFVGTAEQLGTIVSYSGNQIAITKDCSGTSTLSALIPCALAFAYLKQKSPMLTATLIYPVLLLANIIRVLLIIGLVELGGTELAMGWLHRVTGLLVFFIAMLIICSLLSHVTLQTFSRAQLSRLVPVSGVVIVVIVLLNIYGLTFFQSPVDRKVAPLTLAACLLLLNVGRLLKWQKLELNTAVLFWSLLFIIGMYLDIGGLISASLLLALYTLIRPVSEVPAQLQLATAFLIVGMPGMPLLVSAVTGGVAYLLPATIVLALIVFIVLRTAAIPSTRWVIAHLAPVSIVIASLTLISGHDESGSDVLVPYVVGDWVGTDIPLTHSERLLFRNATVIKREYRDHQDTIWFFHVETTQQRNIHPPEYCYTSDGWKIAQTDIVGSEGQFVVSKEDDHRLVTFWYIHDNVRFYDKITFVLRKFTQLVRHQSTWQMTRISSHLNESTEAVIQDFIRQAYP